MSREDKTSEMSCCSDSLSLLYFRMTEYNCCGIPEPQVNFAVRVVLICRYLASCRDSVCYDQWHS